MTATLHPTPATRSARRRTNALADLIDEFHGGPPTGEPLPLAPGRFCLVEVDADGAPWLGCFPTVGAALDRHDALAEVAPTEMLTVVDLDTGERFDPFA